MDDVADGHIRAMETGRAGENSFICGPVHALVDALALAESISGVRAPSLTAAPGMLLVFSRVMGLVERIVPVPDKYSSEYLRVSAGVTYIGSSKKARRDLGWVPRPLPEGLDQTLRYEMQGLGMLHKH